VQPFENCVPLYELDIAAGRLAPRLPLTRLRKMKKIQQPQDFEWVELPAAFHSQRGLFVARVIGNSMNRRILTVPGAFSGCRQGGHAWPRGRRAS